MEPYKCDNSRLLAECNSLHSEIIRQRDTFQQKIFHLSKLNRDTELRNRELADKVAELEHKFGDPKQNKQRNDLINQKRKPFVSTVRSGEFTASALKSVENMENVARRGANCTCHDEKNAILSRLYAEQQANRVKSQMELIDLYKSQVTLMNALNGCQYMVFIV